MHFNQYNNYICVQSQIHSRFVEFGFKLIRAYPSIYI